MKSGKQCRSVIVLWVTLMMCFGLSGCCAYSDPDISSIKGVYYQGRSSYDFNFSEKMANKTIMNCGMAFSISDVTETGFNLRIYQASVPDDAIIPFRNIYCTFLPENTEMDFYDPDDGDFGVFSSGAISPAGLVDCNSCGDADAERIAIMLDEFYCNNISSINVTGNFSRGIGNSVKLHCLKVEVNYNSTITGTIGNTGDSIHYSNSASYYHDVYKLPLGKTIESYLNISNPAEE